MEPVHEPTADESVAVAPSPQQPNATQDAVAAQDRAPEAQQATAAAVPSDREADASDDGVASSSSADSGVPEVYLATLEGTRQVRSSSAEFIDNVGLQTALRAVAHHAVCDDEGTAPGNSLVFTRCDCKFPHDILSCTMLHALSETMRLNKTTMVRIKGLIRNPGLEHLLRKPTAAHQLCCTKKEHDPLLCKHLHRDPRAVPVGRERFGYLPEELVDNQGYRHLLTHSEHSGRWCNNTSKHEPKTCLYLHRAPKRGESLGKRNLNINKDGKFTIKTKTAFEKKPRQSRVVASANTEIPEFAKKQQALDRLVERINSADNASDSEPEASAPSAPLQSLGTSAVQQCNASVKQKTSKNSSWQGANPALWIVLGALLLALLVQLLPEA